MRNEEFSLQLPFPPPPPCRVLTTLMKTTFVENNAGKRNAGNQNCHCFPQSFLSFQRQTQSCGPDFPVKSQTC